MLYGVVAGLVYGGTRALSIYSSASTSDASELVDLNQRLMELIPVQHQVAGLALAAFAAYLVAAPLLP